ncbi:LLM class flavin-dependent oxidoreductase [Microbacterium immunditiarum]|uniref:Alkanesulfonate monooxygenase SsuD/methylene tetrahydromethanopterin reductase-like flavin-dependent oxidoreductase (Luciferase family) n=1 Tax=Microbacterium immunditiarum TaxID=337480 RepID=A0A7Y9GRY1_9MICO|nr:LLM class flavin-dependent oxidoreductase [Microbacterium immunditiarum]NYE21511.1 alkanesulfonate monooxygenase SsuD/methylene tetrahydromethanopterin reductase-like flavin-dependent oxidoreductase (luciferase family) [Microbacterium immunditiarum]
MKFGLFQTPFIHPERTARQTFHWAVEQAVQAEVAGLDEAWVGEHFTNAWENIPNPELVLAAAVERTERITIGPAAHLAPYHHPGHLASQAAWMSNIAEGRYILGLATGLNPFDGLLHGVEPTADKLAMTLESLDVMEKVWSGEPFEHDGTYWKSSLPEVPIEVQRMRSLRPFGGSLTVALGGASPGSTSIKVAGERGLAPMSFGASAAIIADHWRTYVTSARAAGREAPKDRSQHRVTLTMVVADTDAEAMSIVRDGPIARTWLEYMVPHEQRRAQRSNVKPVWDLNATIDELAREQMYVGSPETVAAKLNEMVEATGGWGTTLVLGHDFMDDPARWNESLRLIAEEVRPRVIPNRPADAID